MLYVFFWVIPRRLNFIYRRFGTPCLLLHRQAYLPAYEDGTDRVFRNVGIGTLFSIFVGRYTYLPMKMEQTECSETSADKFQTPGNYPEENIQPRYMLDANKKSKLDSRKEQGVFLFSITSRPAL